MNITIFHLAMLFFASVTIYNIYSAHKYGDSYLPAVLGIMMVFSLLLFLILPWQYGYVSFLATMIFGVINYRKSYDINRKKMRQYIEDSQDTEPLKLVDLLTGWKVIHRLNRKYSSGKASLIYSIYMWFYGILTIFLFSHLWPDINISHVFFITTVVMFGFYWQNKKLLESLDPGDLQQVKEK